MKDNAIGSKKINLSSKNVEIIKRRIHWIDQQINENCNSSQNSKDEIDQKIKKQQKKKKKIVISTAESCAQKMSKYQINDILCPPPSKKTR